MNNKIAWKLGFCFAMSLLLFSFVTGIVFITLFREHTMKINRNELENTAQNIAQTLSSFQAQSNSKGCMMKGSMGGYGAYLRFIDELAMADVWIVDEDMDLMIHGHREEKNFKYSDLPDNAEKIVDRVFTGETTFSEDFSSILNRPTITVGVPIISSDNSIIGTVLLHSSVSGIHEAVSQGVYTMIVSIGTALILSVVLSAILSYFFTKPLNKMKNIAVNLGKGNYGEKTGIKQNDEIGQLAYVIDDLSSKLDEVEKEHSKLEQMRKDFIANVSHELRTPVTVLKGSLEVIQYCMANDSKKVEEYHTQMMRECLHIERLVNDLLDLSRLQNTEFQLEISKVDLCNIVNDSVRAMRRIAREKEISLVAECPEEECIIDGDYSRVRQMLIIVIDNSVKFSKKNGIVNVLLYKNNTGFTLTITDNGSGISQSDIPYIFERFHKSLSQKNKNGTGLGLAIAKQIADRHNIKISVYSQQDIKTEFKFLFL